MNMSNRPGAPQAWPADIATRRCYDRRDHRPDRQAVVKGGIMVRRVKRPEL